MRLNISKSKNASSLYVIKDINVRGKRTTKIVEKLGTYDDLLEKLNGEDPIQWAKEYIKELNEKERQKKQKVIVKYSPVKKIKKDQQRVFNGGYLFLQKIYYELALGKLCDGLSNKYKFTFDLNNILSRLVYGRILFPSSKLTTHRQAATFIEHQTLNFNTFIELLIFWQKSLILFKPIYIKIASKFPNVIQVFFTMIVPITFLKLSRKKD